MSTKPLILHNVSVGTRLLPFSAQVERGALIHIIGPNGAGKKHATRADRGNFTRRRSGDA